MGGGVPGSADAAGGTQFEAARLAHAHARQASPVSGEGEGDGLPSGQNFDESSLARLRRKVLQFTRAISPSKGKVKLMGCEVDRNTALFRAYSVADGQVVTLGLGGGDCRVFY